MQGGLIVNCYLLARKDITQGNKQNMAVQDFHEAVRFTGVINVMCAVTTATAVKTPTVVDGTDS